MVHLRENGFVVKTNDLAGPDLAAVKTRHRVPKSLWSCHTGVVGGYVIEGHVPADLVLRLLRNKPPVAGLAVRGMPIGSPGMPGANREPYEVYSFDEEGNVRPYAHVRP